jgi:hypothetical protein
LFNDITKNKVNSEIDFVYLLFEKTSDMEEELYYGDDETMSLMHSEPAQAVLIEIPNLHKQF